MKPDPADLQKARNPDALSSEKLKELIGQAQHDLRNPLGNILGFCEILLSQLQPDCEKELRVGLQAIYDSSHKIVNDIDWSLDPDKSPASPEEITSLQGELRQRVGQILVRIDALRSDAAKREEALLSADLCRMSDSARRLSQLIETALAFYPKSELRSSTGAPAT